MNEYVLSLYSSAGTPNDDDSIATIYACDALDEPIPAEFLSLGPGAIRCRTEAGNVRFQLLWTMGSFGRLYCLADRDGAGYTPEDSPIDLPYELARSAVSYLHRALATMRSRGVPSLPASWDDLARCQSQLADAAETPDRVSRARIVSEVHALAAERLDTAIVEDARWTVGRFDTERTAGIRFGGNAFGHFLSKGYRDRFEAIFDFATIPFYAAAIEPQRGSMRWDIIDGMLDWLDRAGIEAKGHPLYWGHELNLPAWLTRSSFSTVLELVVDQVERFLGRYGDRITVWDIVNEAHDWPPANVLGFTSEQQIELTRTLSETVARVAPGSSRVLNCTATWAEYAAAIERRGMTPFSYLNEVIDAGVGFEAIGVQYYAPARSLADVSKNLKKYAKLGKPLHITELCAPSIPPEPAGYSMHPIEEDWGMLPREPYSWWRGAWSEKLQADWAEGIYLIAAANEAVEAITWWDFSDDRAVIPGGGLLTESHEPKRAYRRIQGVIDAAHTSR